MKNIKENYNKEEKQEEDSLINTLFKIDNIKLITFINLNNIFYLSFLSFLTRFIPTPETARRSFSSASITDLVVLNPAWYKALALFSPTPGSVVKVSIIFFEFPFFDFVFWGLADFVFEALADLVVFFTSFGTV